PTHDRPPSGALTMNSHSYPLRAPTPGNRDRATKHLLLSGPFRSLAGVTTTPSSPAALPHSTQSGSDQARPEREQQRHRPPGFPGRKVLEKSVGSRRWSLARFWLMETGSHTHLIHRPVPGASDVIDHPGNKPGHSCGLRTVVLSERTTVPSSA